MNKSSLDLLKEYRDIVAEASDDSVERMQCCKCGKNTSRFNCRCGHKLCSSCKDAPPNKKKVVETKFRKSTSMECCNCGYEGPSRQQATWHGGAAKHCPNCKHNVCDKCILKNSPTKVEEKMVFEPGMKYKCVACGTDITKNKEGGIYCADCKAGKKKVKESSEDNLCKNCGERVSDPYKHRCDLNAGSTKRAAEASKKVSEGKNQNRCLDCNVQIPEKKVNSEWEKKRCASCEKKVNKKKVKEAVDVDDEDPMNSNQYTAANFFRDDTRDISKTFKIDKSHVLRVIFYNPTRGDVKVRFKLSVLTDMDESPAPQYKDFTDEKTARVYALSAWGIDIFRLQEGR